MGRGLVVSGRHDCYNDGCQVLVLRGGEYADGGGTTRTTTARSMTTTTWMVAYGSC